MIPIYRAGRQLLKVRAVMISSLVGLAACIRYGVDLAQTYGLSPGDGGTLASLPARLMVGGLVVFIGLAFAVGMLFCGRHCAARSSFDPARKQAHLDTVSFFWDQRHRIGLTDIGEARYHEDIDLGGLDEPLRVNCGAEAR